MFVDWITSFNTLRPRQNGRHFTDDTFKRIFLNENVCISLEISLKFVPMGPINNMPALVQKMAWHRPGDKPLSFPMMVSLPMHICVTRPKWVKAFHQIYWNHATLQCCSSLPGWNGCHFADNIFKCVFLNVNVKILIQIALTEICF